jgi:glycerophosphoryl diester phosphodiesterase
MLRFDCMADWQKTMIIAHRGANHRGRGKTTYENTLESFAAAVATGADAIELDVRRTADGILIVHHDEKVRRLRRPLERMTLDEARVFADRRGYYLPTFEEALAACAGHVALDIELKEPGYERDVVSLTGKYYDFANVAFTSFSDAVIRRIKTIETRAVTGLLFGGGVRNREDGRIRDTYSIRRIRNCRADFVAPNHRLLHLGFIRRMRRYGVPIIVWTVNNVRRARRLADHGIAAIITDHPGKLLE